ncbi:MAG: hypothetical protein OXT74_12745 [Candidatus Poribacteria bacterium]|nr:hypothetical protein [Candidatus Poribacteria bacterium]
MRIENLFPFLLLFIALTCTSCSGDEDFSNPLDPENLRTAGAPTGLTLAPGNQQVRVSWKHVEYDGITKYRIYRRYSGDPNPQFQRIAEVDAPTTEFLDTKDINNDQFDSELGTALVYEYRITYVDRDGVETPDPNSPPSEDADPPKIWPIVRVTPSEPPPAPTIVLGDPTDLTVKLFWQDYVPPEDFEIFRVFAAVVDDSAGLGKFRLLGETTKDRPFFFDEDFSRDGITKVYHVIAVDRAGVEAVTRIRAASPDLPPAPPQGFRAAIIPLPVGGRYDVYFSWIPNKEKDLAGYQLYASSADGELLSRPRVDAKHSSHKFSADQAILVGQRLVARKYFITAFDDTPRADGSLDESELVAAQQ